MLKKYIVLFLVLVAAGGAFWLVFKPQKVEVPQSTPSPTTPSPINDRNATASVPVAVNSTGLPLKLPTGFSISIFAKNLPSARVMVFDSKGNMVVSQTPEGKISLLEIKDGKVISQKTILDSLRNPHGLAFDPNDSSVLYFAEEDKISKMPNFPDGEPQKIIDLPTGGAGHITRTIKFGADNKLYVAVGSACDVCYEQDPRRAGIFSMNKDGSDFKNFATGLRNAVFFIWNLVDGKMWATEMGRNDIGDDLPPDEIDIIKQGKNYGWPICYGKNIHDNDFDKNVYIRNPCMEPFEEPSYIDIQAHSAPLGLAFVPEGLWSKEYWHNLLVAFHGSIARTKPTGYKIVRYIFDKKGAYLSQEDFISGWLAENGVLGRPVDILFGQNNAMYVSDDKAGVIYEITYVGK